MVYVSFSICFFLDFSGTECEDSELVSHLMPGTESRSAVSPFACLSNITDQDLFGVHVTNDVSPFCCDNFFHSVYSSMRNSLYLIRILGQCLMSE